MYKKSQDSSTRPRGRLMPRPRTCPLVFQVMYLQYLTYPVIPKRDISIVKLAIKSTAKCVKWTARLAARLAVMVETTLKGRLTAGLMIARFLRHISYNQTSYNKWNQLPFSIHVTCPRKSMVMGWDAHLYVYLCLFVAIVALQANNIKQKELTTCDTRNNTRWHIEI